MNMQRTRIKICGIRRPEDAVCVAQAGADAVGLVFFPPSPRAVSIKEAQAVCDALPPFMSVVALFVNPAIDEVAAVLDALPVDLLQFHGGESGSFASQFTRPYIKSVAMGELAQDDYRQTLKQHPKAQGFLYDKFDPTRIGGTGEAFDWSSLPADEQRPLILAGGLGVDNVADAVKQVRPYAVDVSSGVEKAKGIKCADKIHAFCRAVRQADDG